ncbi:cysteine desulfurase family protein [Halobacteriovorax sp. HLS]|uniref:cysteine desulfurase family protein n=1 Tax=Halobacteriovorax sp. HLS TaxID=2234000 RepID=UPI000FD92F61|nr:aminotransferase class V-fold PLP-dependent enzyme [Halobacteriovorax sp. HLS]
MARLINNRYYFDYNATSPLASSVKQWLPNGDLLFANPSSIHSSGKKTKKFINETRNYLYEIFSLNKSEYKLFFHSGATEAINSILKGFAQKAYASNERVHLIHSTVDHSCVFNLKNELELYGHGVIQFNVDSSGDYELEALIDQINSVSTQSILNFTWVNNETGVVWPLDALKEIKERTNCFIHVDAVQSVGKISNWTELSSYADAYTFSGHKFGSLKGIGFSFLKEDLPFCSMIRGGGQQDGLRSGTENTYGIYSLKLALEEIVEANSFEELTLAKSYIENELTSLLNSKTSVIGSKAKNRNSNTLSILLPGYKADILITAFDLAKMDVSSGSACSSGAVLPSRVLMAMGVSEEDAKSAIRFSFAHDMTLEQAKEYTPIISKVLKRFIK